MLTEERAALRGSVTQLTGTVQALAAAYESIPPWSSAVSEKVKVLTAAGIAHSSLLQNQSQAIAELAASTKISLSSHDDAISSLTAQQSEMASSILEYVKTTDQLVAAIPKMASHQQATKAEVAALRIDNNKLYRWMKECVSAFYDDNKGEREVAENDVLLNNADHREILLESFSLRPIAERPELEAEAVAELSWANMDTDSDDDDDFDAIDFPEFNPDELRMYDLKIKEWAVDEIAKIEGESVSYELARWQWMNREADDDVNMDDDNDGNDGDDNNDDGDDENNDEDDNDQQMEDQQVISSIRLKRKRSSKSSPTSGSDKASKTKRQSIGVTEKDISATMSRLNSILAEESDSPSAPQLQIVISEVNPEQVVTATLSPQPVTSIEPTATNQLTLPITTATQPTEATTITTTATQPPEITKPNTDVSSLMLSSESGSLHSGETKEERIARKIRERQEMERQMILKIQAEAELKEEEERKKRLKEQSDADRAYMLKLSGKEAEERDRLMRIKKDQEESDVVMARLLQDIEKTEIQREKEAKSASDVSKGKGGDKASVDRMWNEIDRKKYAARMTGRSNPAPITKVNLKKPKNKSQAQLLIHRGLETQAINLDQVCKLHREEWNEIRLAVSHSSSAAKKEVLNEIDRLFQKMVALQLLRPEDTVILGEEIVQPPSPRYRSGTSSIYRIPNTSRLNLSIPDGMPRVEGFEVTEGERGLVYRDSNGALRFQREAELEKIDHEQLVHLIRSASMLDKNSHMRKAILDEALARQFRYLPSTDKYELADELGMVKDEEFWRDI